MYAIAFDCLSLQLFLLLSCIMFAVVGDVICFFHVLSMQHVLYPFCATGKPSREEVAFEECQEKLLHELLQHFEIGVPRLKNAARCVIHLGCMMWFHWGWQCKDISCMHGLLGYRFAWTCPSCMFWQELCVGSSLNRRFALTRWKLGPLWFWHSVAYAYCMYCWSFSCLDQDMQWNVLECSEAVHGFCASLQTGKAHPIGLGTFIVWSSRGGLH